MDSTLASLKKLVKGQVFTPEDGAKYEEAKDCWNKDTEGKPSIIVRVSGVADVVAVVKWLQTEEGAKVLGTGLAVACGRHSPHCFPDGAIVIDLATLSYVSADKETRIVRVGGGTRLGTVDREAELVGLGTTFGHNPTTGVAGLTCAGGFGHLAPLYGMSVDSLIECQVVTADGVVQRVSGDNDLFWALRGGGGNFGIVTEFVFKLHEMPPSIMGGEIVHLRAPPPQRKEGGEEAGGAGAGAGAGGAQQGTDNRKKVLREALDYMAQQDTPRETMFFAAVAPDVVAFNIGHLPVNGQTLEDSTKSLEKLRSLGNPVVDSVREMKYSEFQSLALPQQQPGHWYERGALIPRDNLPDSLLDSIFREIEQMRGTKVAILIAHLGGKLNEVPPEATAFAHRGAKWWVLVLAPFKPEEREKVRSFAKSFYENELFPLSEGGGYAAVIGEHHHSNSHIWAGNLPKLQQLKKKYDPTNFFKHNRNILPSE
mmetsp:Transcript_15012/g.21014  ORF Transcript_15012/g.21014 Transcript_15012/m.21014 type:complete len:483 (+) Transcript_15012:118-1566(+)|eukprot:CAMPEP_0201488940 /NCGR_PEP_ID=MMETSP0151_2-20130828/20541_1 /ASSEMBLY_ACC=CAM_ASM_000257 /TAXON_ID=200890 /ORGANISM="Paramoeba atlantica, Strain 621/1 / CCAP 1560/9" /LENGTH=482 /DNA_ID=CAMNT_0047874379 /DNA_START=78 /DNA_END=1526 /DNA_ORIENTATION=+